MINIDLKGKKAIVFGVANENSIAWAIAKELDKAGCQICLGYQERVKPLMEPLIPKLNNAKAFPCDVVDDALLDSFFEKVKTEFGKIDIIIHSIAFGKKQHLQGKFLEVDRRGYQVAQEVSSFSLAEITRRALPMMNDNGSILAMTYLGSVKVIPNYNVMGVAKAALESCVRYLAADVGEKGIRVNAISAGPIKTLAASGISGFENILGHIASKTPLKRNISQEDVGNAALFLCSDMSKNITGHILYVDAGYNIMGL
jgi:enoyl-[acyl-carrier protein] reductase I